jgi:hypothetical protein
VSDERDIPVDVNSMTVAAWAMGTLGEWLPGPMGEYDPRTGQQLRMRHLDDSSWKVETVQGHGARRFHIILTVEEIREDVT